MSKSVSPILIILFLFSTVYVKSQEYYWVAFTNKDQTAYSLSEPEKYLSVRSIQRRIRQQIPIDSLDLPVNSAYINQVTKIGAELVHTSKWLNGITVKSEIDSFSNKITQLSFVKEVQLTKPNITTKSTFDKFNLLEGEENYEGDSSIYGPSVHQIELMNGQFLHQQNYRGEGMQIAVLDAGFYNVDIYNAFDSLWANKQIIGTKDFVNPKDTFFHTHYHGMSVLSVMGGNIPGELVGTASKASYLLLRSEETGSEYIIEEDNWVAAAEYADSVGCDIINTSLGYSTFYDSATDHTYADMDGKTTRVTQGANIAFSKGILVFSSAGNEGQKNWKYITAPADGDEVIAVGAVNRDSVIASFSSRGPAFDGDIKPNIVAVGLNAYVQKSTGDLGFYSGTSFASPIMAGMAACLWQVNPNASAAVVKNILEVSSHQYNYPDSMLGYGIPNMVTAMELMTNLTTNMVTQEKNWRAYPNPINETLYLSTDITNLYGEVKIEIYSIDGKLLRNYKLPVTNRIELKNLRTLPSGILLLRIENADLVETIKLSKIR